jgi:hypothetical protein
MAGIFFVKAKTDYDKGDSNWTVELSTTTKVTTILAFDPHVKLHFLPKNTICNFYCHMLQPFTTTTIAFIVIIMHGEIDSKFELLVANRNSPKDIQIVNFLKSRFLKNIAFSFFQLELMVHLFSCG